MISAALLLAMDIGGIVQRFHAVFEDIVLVLDIIGQSFLIFFFGYLSHQGYCA